MRNAKKVKFSLMFKLMLPILAILLLSIGISGALSYVGMSKVLNNEMETFTAQQMSDIVARVEESTTLSQLVEQNLSESSIIKAKALSRIIAANPEVLQAERMQELADMLGVEEVHVTDDQGIIRFGNVPEFLGFDFHSSQQTQPFLAALTDKNFTLAQAPSERAVDKKLFQYMGVARQDTLGIVQVGFSPVYIQKLTERSSMNSIVHSVKFGQNGYIFVTDAKGVITHHQKEGMVGKTLKNLGINDSFLGSKSGAVRYTLNREAKYFQYTQLNSTQYLYLAIPQIEFLHPLAGLLIQIILTVILSVFCSFFIALLLTRKIFVRKIQDIVQTLNKIATGDLHARCQIKSRDEFYLIATSLNTAAENVSRLVNDVASSAQEVMTSAESLAAVTVESSASIDEVARAVDELAKGASEQAAQAQDTSMKLMELAEELDTISSVAQDIHTGAEYASQSNQRGMESMELLKQKLHSTEQVSLQAVENVNSLSAKSTSIMNIINTIQAIAQQTNLLALNAAIEAARAGEQGKGFAVVAEEIRKLADQTSRSASEIGTLIKDVNQGIGNTKDIMDTTAATVRESGEVMVHSTQAFQEIYTAVQQALQLVQSMAKSLHRVNDSKNNAVASIQEISAISEESAASTQQVSASMEEQTSSMENISQAAEALRNTAISLEKAIESFKV